MPIDVFRDRMDNDIRPMIQWILYIGGQESIIHNHQDPVLVRNVRNSTNVHERERWVRGSLDPNQFGLIFNHGPRIDLDGARKRDADPVGSRNLGEVPVRPAVHIRDGDDVGACSKALQDRSGRRRPRREGQCVVCILERSYRTLEVVPVGVRAPRVLVQAKRRPDRSLDECGRE